MEKLMPEPQIYQKPPLITVFGGSGFVGRYLAENLAKRGYRIRIACRYPERAYYMRQIGDVGQLQMVKANAADARAVERALAGAAAAVYLPGLLRKRGKNTLRAVHIDGAENVARLAAQARIKLIHISALSAGLGSRQAYLRSKAEGEEKVRAAHKKAIILRPSLIFGREDRFFSYFADMARFSPVLPLFGGGPTKFQPVYAGDVAEAIARAAEETRAEGRIYELGGPEILSFRALLEEMLRIIRRRRSFIRVPLPLGVLLGACFGAAGQIRLLRYDSLVSEEAQSEGRTLEGLGIAPAALDAHLAPYLWRFRVGGQFSQKALRA